MARGALASLTAKLTKKSASKARRAARGGARPGARRRLNRMRAKRAGGRFGRTFLSEMFGIDIPDPFQGNLFEKRGGGTGSGGPAGGDDFDVTLPTKKSPETFSKISNPTFATINDQIKDLIKIAKKLNVISDKQERDIIESAESRERASNEARLEPANDNDASMVQGADLSGGSIGALEPEINKLISAIQDLRDKIEAGGDQSQGFGGKLASAAGTAVTTAAVLGRSGLQAVGRGVGAIGRGVGAVGTKLASVGTAAAAATAKVAKGIGISTTKASAATATANLTGQALKNRIKTVAKPLVLKGLLKTGLKSIPLVGAVAGLGFALSRLVQGDPVGAGLEATSGLAGPVTAIPALVASLARDVYYETYGVFPEQDALAGERLPAIKDGIEEIAKEQLRKEVVVKDDTKAPAATVLPPPTPRMEAQPMAKTITPGGGGGGGAAPTTNDTLGLGDGSQTKSVDAIMADSGGANLGGEASNVAATAAPAATAAVAEPAPADGEGDDIAKTPVENTPITGIQPSGNVPVPAMTTSGAAIEAASGPAAAPTIAKGSTGTSTMAPSTTPTTKPNASGRGDVPEPSYMGAGDLAMTLYFGSVAGAMAR